MRFDGKSASHASPGTVESLGSGYERVCSNLIINRQPSRSRREAGPLCLIEGMPAK